MSIFTVNRSNETAGGQLPQVTSGNPRALPTAALGGLGGHNTWDFESLANEPSTKSTPRSRTIFKTESAMNTTPMVNSKKRASPTSWQSSSLTGPKRAKHNEYASKPRDIIDIVSSDSEDGAGMLSSKRPHGLPAPSVRRVPAPAFRATTPIKPKYFGHAHDRNSNTPPRTHGVFASIPKTSKPIVPNSSLPSTLGGRLNLGTTPGAAAELSSAPVARILEPPATTKNDGRVPFMQIDDSDEEDMVADIPTAPKAEPLSAGREHETAAKSNMEAAKEQSRLMREAAKRRTHTDSAEPSFLGVPHQREAHMVREGSPQ